LRAEPSQFTDSDLLHAIARGDEAALATCYDRYRVILFSLILRILHDRQEAEDVLQDVFMQVWRKARDFDESRGRAFTWLVTIARSRALDRLRGAGSRARLQTEAAQAPPNDIVDPAAEAQRSEHGTIVRQALAELSDDQQKALYLGYFEGLTQTEIATRLDAPLGTVKTRMRSGLLKLRELLHGKLREPI